jgi:hypothetical protein
MINKEKAHEFFRQHKLICFAVIFIAVMLLVVITRNSEPSYQGKTASEWLNMRWNGQAEFDAALAERKTAFDAMGEKAVMHFARELSAGDSFFEQTLEKLNRKLGRTQKGQASFMERKMAASNNLQFLGTHKLADLSPTVPHLLKLASHSSAKVRNNCLSILEYCHSHEELVVPAMKNLLNSADVVTSIRASRVLANYPSSSEIARNHFKHLLNHTNSGVFLHVSLIIKDIAPDQRAAWLTPKHSLHLRNPDSAWRTHALYSLTLAYPEDSENMRYATNLLHDPDPRVRAVAIDCFSKLANSQPQYLPLPASNVLDICIASLDDSSEFVRNKALIEIAHTWESKATNALPKLEQLYKSPTNFSGGIFNRAEIGKIIQRISPEKAKELGIDPLDKTPP